jgi:hypothetical protein
VDLSFLNPYSVLQEPVLAFRDTMKDTHGDAIAATQESLGKLLEPWTTQQLFMGAMIDVARGETAIGYPIRNIADSTQNQITDSLAHLYRAVAPGTLLVADRIWKAAEGRVIAGRSFNLANEIIGPIVGQRLASNDPLNAFKQKNVKAFSRFNQEARNLMNKEFVNNGTPDLDAIREDYIQANNARMKNFRELAKDVKALRGLGYEEREITGAMLASGLTRDEIGQVLKGIYVRAVPSDKQAEKARNMLDWEARVAVLKQAIESYPEKQELNP